jgi:N-hydroxyarylamine O-acetyltransferase
MPKSVVGTDNRFDLDAYLLRIAYEGPREPSLAVLGAIVAAQAAAIPYENVDVLLGRGVRLDIASLQHKLVQGGRGGYCFEQNTLLEAALEGLGFTVTSFSARVVFGLPVATPAAHIHKLIQIDLSEGPYVADLGFAGMTPTAPLAVRREQVQTTPHQSYRFMPHGSEIALEVLLNDTWESLYRFGAEPAAPVDFEMSNWFTATSPRSAFRANLIVAHANAKGRVTILNRRLRTRTPENQIVQRTLSGIADYRDVLVGQFGLRLDDSDLAAITDEMAPHPEEEAVQFSIV